jgi:uncharacterized protein (DUF111 family)
MKKGRPGVLLAVQCRHEDTDRLEALLFAETPTLGIRRSIVERRVLPRRRAQVETEFGAVQGVVTSAGSSSSRFSAEYEACRRIAEERGVPIHRIFDAAVAAFLASLSAAAESAE